jgi:hypothetical protein
MMLPNESSFDRALRIVIGSVLLALVFFGPHTAWGWLGVVPLATGLIGYCPLYRLIGVKTSAAPASHGGCCS